MSMSKIGSEQCENCNNGLRHKVYSNGGHKKGLIRSGEQPHEVP